MAKAKQTLVVGRWNDGVFTVCEQQPDGQVTEMVEMIAWVKRTFADRAGTYEFIRKVPGAFIATQQIEFAFME